MAKNNNRIDENFMECELSSNMNRIGRVYKYNLNYDYESGR